MKDEMPLYLNNFPTGFSCLGGRAVGVCVDHSTFPPLNFVTCTPWASVYHACSVAQSCPAVRGSVDCTCQAPLSMGFSRQGYWSGLPFLSPGDLPNPGIEPRSPALQADSLLTELQGKPLAQGTRHTTLLKPLTHSQTCLKQTKISLVTINQT